MHDMVTCMCMCVHICVRVKILRCAFIRVLLLYIFKVLSTNFSDEESYYNLLDTLDGGFDELLSHEAIEDHYIIHPLLPRLPSTVKVTLQNDVHSDNRLSVLHGKIKKQLGMSIVSHSERLHFGEELQEELFGLKLIPHMDEEEEVNSVLTFTWQQKICHGDIDLSSVKTF